MARDYDYLFKLLIIGDSGKRMPGMRDGKLGLVMFFGARETETLLMLAPCSQTDTRRDVLTVV